ncbi:MAG TPA: FAD binding domain-containing protein [Gaiellaceae bacterium]|nr:FAD binding domain-containing protein [Gaiellaceae bacterium]
MKFPPFAYRAPASLDDALTVLASDPQAKVIAGGQSLLPLLALRLAQPTLLVDLGSVADLAFVEADDGVVRVGAMTTLATLEDSQLVAEKLPLLAQAIRYVAHRPIRNRGTLGGSLAHADPAAELPAVALALGATLVSRGPAGERRLDAADFFTGPFATGLGDDEILTSVEFPVRAGSWSFQEVARRSGDFALAIAAVGVELEGETCTGSTVVLHGVGSRPIRSTAAEAILNGAVAGDDVAARAGDAAAAELRPAADIHGSSEYRKRVAAALVRRAALDAGRRAQ